MMKAIKHGLAAAAMFLMAVPAHADESMMSKFHVDFYGFIKGEYAYNARGLGNVSPARANDAPGGAPTASDANGQSVITARQSRFGFKISGPELLAGGKTSALLETDFYGAQNTNESPTLRMRHAWGAIDWTDTQLLFGQTWDTFGPYIKPTIDFGAGKNTGAPNNPRVPMFRLTQKVGINPDNQLSFVLAAQNPSQDNLTDSAAALPASAQTTVNSIVNLAGQINFTSKALGVAPGYMGAGVKPLKLGVFALYGNAKAGTNNTPRPGKQVDSYGEGLYAFVPLLNSEDGKGRAMTLSFEGETYLATDMAFNGATAAAFDAATFAERKGFGVAGSLTFYPTQELGINAGYGRRGVINPGVYAPSVTAELYNQEFFANLTYDLNAAVRVGAEYQHMETQFKTTATSNTMGINNIGRLAFYYYF